MVRIADDLQFLPSAELVSKMMMRKTICANNVIVTCQKAMEVAGGSGFLRGLGLERRLRDAYAGQFHPLPEKRQQLFTGRLTLGLSPVMDIVWQRIPQTLWVVGLGYLVGTLIALPIGIISAYRQYSWFDQIGTFVSMVGFSVPTFFTGVLLIVIFSVNLGWFPSIYDTTLVVDSWANFVKQAKQMVLPVSVLALYNAAQISRFMRASMLDNLNQDYVRTARAKGLGEKAVVLVHVLRNSMIPVVTVIALGVPQVFGGAIITEQVFKVNGLGQLLITAIQANDIPMVQTLTVIFAVLIILFNLIADVLYGVLDPRIRYD